MDPIDKIRLKVIDELMNRMFNEKVYDSLNGDTLKIQAINQQKELLRQIRREIVDRNKKEEKDPIIYTTRNSDITEGEWEGYD